MGGSMCGKAMSVINCIMSRLYLFFDKLRLYIFPVSTILLSYVILCYSDSQVTGWYFSKAGIKPFLWTLFDSFCLFFLGYVLGKFGKNVRVCCCIAFAVTFILGIVNIVYSRYFETYCPLSMVSEGGNLPLTELLQYFVSAFKINDIFLLLPLGVFLLIFKYYSKNHNNYCNRISVKFSFCWLWIGILFYIMGLCNLIGHAHIPSKDDFSKNPIIPHESEMAWGGAKNNI